jgi:hypothetical protein
MVTLADHFAERLSPLVLPLQHRVLEPIKFRLRRKESPPSDPLVVTIAAVLVVVVSIAAFAASGCVVSRDNLRSAGIGHGAVSVFASEQRQVLEFSSKPHAGERVAAFQPAVLRCVMRVV